MENDFDPLEHEQALEECGVPRPQAMVHAKGLARVASRCLGMCGVNQAIAPLVVRMDHFQAELDQLNAEFHEFKNNVEGRFDGVLERLNRLERKCERLEAMLKMHLALLSVLITMVGGVLVKQFFPS